MIEIKPTRIFRKGTATQIDVVVSNYEPNGTSVALTWQLKSAAGEMLDGDTDVFGEAIVNQWNANDDVLTDALLVKLELEKA